MVATEERMSRAIEGLRTELGGLEGAYDQVDRRLGDLRRLIGD